MIYRLLGQLQIGEDGRSLDLPNGHTLVVLAALVVNANRRMSKTELLRAAWGDETVAESQLYKSISAARRLLKGIGRRDDLVTHDRHGYEIRLPDDKDLDMLLFQRLVRQADQAGTEQRTDDEIDHLRQALELWRGPHPLSNVPGETLRQEISQLEQRRKRAAVRLFDLEIAHGGYEATLGGLQLIASYYPADERLCEQLMITQYRCGHATDAIAAYELHATALSEETGRSPDASLRQLQYAIGSADEEAIEAAESAIARRARAIAVARPFVAPPSQTPSPAVPRQLPPGPANFVGRDDLIAEATWLLGRAAREEVPVIVISGPGGIGKTALALRVSHQASERYPDGQLYMELRDTAGDPVDASEALAQFLRALDVPTVPESLTERAATYRTLLADLRVLIFLDDAASGAQVRELIPANPACGVVITARQKLPDVDGAHHMPPLAPLERAEATGLFLRVVAGAGINLRSDSSGVDRVVALCGGLPLALRLAAALRVHDHPRPTAELAERLEGQGSEALTYGERSMARTIGAGFDRLGEAARQLFLELGMLQLRSFGLWTAGALLREPGVDATAALSELAVSNMIELVESEVRYRFHELTRDYACRRALDTYPDEAVRDARLAQVYRSLLTLTRRAHAGLNGGDFEVVHSTEPDWDAPPAILAEVDEAPRQWFEKERLNIRAAISHCAQLGLIEVCWDLAVSAHEFYTVGEYFDDWHATHLIALRACQHAGDTRGEGVVLACLGQPALVASRAGDVSGPAELERAARLLAERGDRHGQAIALRTLANALRRRGHLARPLQLFHDALSHYEASGDTVGQSQTLRFIGQTYLDLGDFGPALDKLRQAESVADALREQRLLAQTRYWIGQTHLAAGDLGQARAAFTAVLRVFGEPAGLGHAYAVHGLGNVARLTGAPLDAERYLTLAADLARGGPDALLEGRVLVSIGALQSECGQPEGQVSALEKAVECFAGCGAVYLEWETLCRLGTAQAVLGCDEGVRTVMARAEDLYAQMALPEQDRKYRGHVAGTE